MGEKDERMEAADEQKPQRWWHINKTFLPIKIAYFLYFAGVMAILPLLTLHMTEIGLTLRDVAQVYLFTPVVSCIGPPIAGYIADRTGQIRLVYVAFLIVNAAVHHALFYVPVSEHTRAVNLRRSVNPSSIPCTAWPPPVCGNLTRGHKCRVTCPEAAPPVLSVCTTAGIASCLERGEQWSGEGGEVHLPLNSTGCVDNPRLLVNGSTKMALSDPGQVICPAECHMTCDPTNERLVSDRRTFWTYFTLRLCAGFFLAPCFTLLDATNLDLVKSHKIPGQNFGRQRASGILASVAIPPLTGWLVDVTSGPGGRNYVSAFWIMDACSVLAIMALFVFRMQLSLPQKPKLRQAAKLLKQAEVLVFIIVVFLLGCLWGYLESFLFVYLRELKAPTYMLGLTMTVAGVASLPFNWYSETICKRVGHVNILIVSFFGYAARFIGYSLIRNPWLCFPFELLEVVTTHLMWNSAATYAGQLAPSGLLATLTGMAGSLHYSFGRGVGSFVGGYLMSSVGSARAFQILGTAGGVSGALYLITHYCCLRQHISRRQAKQTDERTAAAPKENGQMDREMAAIVDETAGVAL